MTASLEDLDEEAMIQILTEPKNALIKQFKKFLELEKVKLKFTDSALVAIAKEAIERKTGARGLRSILEEIMLDSMYELPDNPDVVECIVNEDVIQRRERPLLLYETQDEKQAS